MTYDWVSKVTIALMVAFITWSATQMSDRYRASTAERDLKKIRAEIELVQARMERSAEAAELRMRERITVHQTAGPHDDVERRLVTVEQATLFMREALSEIKTDLSAVLRYLGDDDYDGRKRNGKK